MANVSGCTRIAWTVRVPTAQQKFPPILFPQWKKKWSKNSTAKLLNIFHRHCATLEFYACYLLWTVCWTTERGHCGGSRKLGGSGIITGRGKRWTTNCSDNIRTPGGIIKIMEIRLLKKKNEAKKLKILEYINVVVPVRLIPWRLGGAPFQETAEKRSWLKLTLNSSPSVHRPCMCQRGDANEDVDKTRQLPLKALNSILYLDGVFAR